MGLIRRAVPFVVLASLLVASTGCLTERTFRLPDPATVALAQSATQTEVRWTIGQVYVDGLSDGRTHVEDWRKARLQLEEHLERVLIEGRLPGKYVEHVKDADVTFDVTVQVEELRTPNGWSTATIVAYALAAGGGTALSLLSSDDSALGRNGIVVGHGVGLAILGAGTFLPGTDASGSFDSVLTVRRAEDGVSIAEHRFDTGWTERLNTWGVTEKVERASSASAVELDKVLLASAAAALHDVPASALRARPGMAPAVSRITSTDAPWARLALLPEGGR